MLTAATISMSLGTDAASIRLPSSDRTDSTANLFAQSFDESSALADGAESKDLKNSVDAEDPSPVKSGGVVVAAASLRAKQDAKVRVSGDSINTKPGPSLAGMKVPSSATGGATKGTLPSNGASGRGESSTAIPPEGTEGAKEAVQKSLPVTVGSAEIDSKDEAADLQTSGLASQSPDGSKNYVELASHDAKHLLVITQKQATVSANEEKTTDATVKKERSAKPEEIKDKAARVVKAATEASVQSANLVLPVVTPAAPRLQGSSKVSDDALLSPAPITSATNVVLAAAKDSQSGKSSVATEKTDDGNKRTSVAVSGEDAASRKSEVDASKAASSMEKAPEGANSKLQMVVTAAVAANPAHVGSKTEGVELNGVPANTSAPIFIAARSQTAQHGVHETVTHADPIASDGGASLDGTHRTLMATPTSLEVGVVDGSHGWLKIRAEMSDGGVVNASLSTATSSGQEMLHRELPALTAYLQSERVAVNNVAIQSTTTREFERSMNGEAQGQTPQSGRQGGESKQEPANVVAGRAENETRYIGKNGIGADGLLSPVSHFGGGSWLNVRV